MGLNPFAICVVALEGAAHVINERGARRRAGASNDHRIAQCFTPHATSCRISTSRSGMSIMTSWPHGTV
jgi:hypothetical protein